MDENIEEFKLPLVLIDAENVPIHYVNHFIVQHQQNEFIITMGQVAPPFLVGSLEEQKEQVKHLTHVPINVVGRIALTRARLEELIQALKTNLEAYDKKHGGE